MTIEQQLKDYIVMKHGSLVEFSKVIDMPNTTLSSIINRGVHTASVANIIKICKALGITVDGLANDKIVSVDGKSIEPRSIDDLKVITRLFVCSSMYVLSKDDKLKPDDVHTISDAIEIAIEMIKRRHKRNRGDSE